MSARTDWIEHTGDECPVGGRVKVQLRTETTSCSDPFSAELVRWDNSKRRNKLLAYRIVGAARDSGSRAKHEDTRSVAEPEGRQSGATAHRPTSVEIPGEKE